MIASFSMAAPSNSGAWSESTLFARSSSGEPSLPRWTSSRQSLSSELAGELAGFRAEAGQRLVEHGPAGTAFLARSDVFELDDQAADGPDRALRGAGPLERDPSGVRACSSKKSPSPDGRGRDLTLSRSAAPRGL